MGSVVGEGGRRRVRPLTDRDRWHTLAVEVLAPYLKRKLDKAYAAAKARREYQASTSSSSSSSSSSLPLPPSSSSSSSSESSRFSPARALAAVAAYLSRVRCMSFREARGEAASALRERLEALLLWVFPLLHLTYEGGTLIANFVFMVGLNR